LENIDEEEVEVSTQINEEELVNLKEQEIEVEIVHNIDSYRCDIYVHALERFSSPQNLNIVVYIKKKKL
jgi:hypothetical protein